MMRPPRPPRYVPPRQVRSPQGPGTVAPPRKTGAPPAKGSNPRPPR